MKRARKTFYLLAFAFATWTTSGVAVADQQPSRVMAQKMSATATVDKVDPQKRELSLRDEQGNQFMVHVPEDVMRFDAIKKGDRINIDYYQSVAMSLKKPGEAGAPPAGGEATVTERAAGNLPGGMMARKITASAEVMKVDRADNKVTIKGPAGEVDTINVTDPAAQADLAKLKKGDRIQASYTEAIAISVTPQSKEK